MGGEVGRAMCARRGQAGFLAGSVRITGRMLPAGRARVIGGTDELEAARVPRDEDVPAVLRHPRGGWAGARPLAIGLQNRSLPEQNRDGSHGRVTACDGTATGMPMRSAAA